MWVKEIEETKDSMEGGDMEQTQVFPGGAASTQLFMWPWRKMGLLLPCFLNSFIRDAGKLQMFSI